MESLEAIEARLRRLEAGVRRLREAYDALATEQKILILTQRREKERLKARLLHLREKIELALSHGRRDSDMDDTRAAPDSTSAAQDHSAIRSAPYGNQPSS